MIIIDILTCGSGSKWVYILTYSPGLGNLGEKGIFGKMSDFFPPPVVNEDLGKIRISW